MTKTDDAQYSVAEKEAFKTRITEFGFFVKKINPYLLSVKSQIAQFLTSKQATIVSYTELYKIIDRYEELNLNHYTENKSSQLIFNSPESKDVKECMQNTAGALRNPYIDLYHWVKGEMYDILALQACIRSRADVEAVLKELENKKKSTQETA